MFPDEFLAHAATHGDFAKSSKFGVLIFKPPGLVIDGLFTSGLSFQCEQAILPGYNINTVEQQVFGPSFSIAATPETPQPLELTFISVGDLWERKFFEDWMEFIMPKSTSKSSADSAVFDTTTRISEKNNINSDFQNNSEYYSENVVKWSRTTNTNRAAGSVLYRDEYISTIQVTPFFEMGIPSARYTFEEAYPVSVAPSQLNWGDDSIIRLNITFKYTSWSREQNININKTNESFDPNQSNLISIIR